MTTKADYLQTIIDSRQAKKDALDAIVTKLEAESSLSADRKAVCQAMAAQSARLQVAIDALTAEKAIPEAVHCCEDTSDLSETYSDADRALMKQF